MSCAWSRRIAARWATRSSATARRSRLRMVTQGDTHFGEHGWRDRIRAARRSGTRWASTPPRTGVVHGEADGLPSLIVDRYADWLVLQSLSQATDRHLPAIVDALVELLSPKGILARNDPKVRTLEGLEQTVEVLYGEVPEFIEVREGPVTYQVDPRHGQKTGLFLDQRENREAAAGMRAADCSTASATTAASRCIWPTSASRCWRWTHRPMPSRASPPTPRATTCRTSTAREGNVFDELRVLRARRRAVRHDRARPAGLCEEQGVGREGVVRLQGHQPARAAAAVAWAACS